MNRLTLRDDATFVDLIRARAREDPDSTAYVMLGSDGYEAAMLTYSQLDLRARAIAAHMQTLGDSGQRVLLQYPRGLDYITGFLGCLYAGNIAVPVYRADQKRWLSRVQNIVADASPTIVLGNVIAESRVARQLAEGPELKHVCYLHMEQIQDDYADRWTEPALTGDSLALLQYTSGSTSDPKGVMLTHTNLLYNQHLIQNAFETSESSVIVNWLPLFHDMGLIGGVLQPLYAGAKCILMSPASFLQRPVQWLDAISRYRATTSGGPNFAYELCIRRVSDDRARGLDLSSWTAAFSGAEMVRSETIAKFSNKFAASGFRKETFYPCYGLAEATLMVSGGRADEAPRILSVSAKSLHRAQVKPAEATEAARALVSCGHSLGDQEIVIVDPDSGKPLAEREIGEIWISGASVAAGYWRREEKTKEVFHARIAGRKDKKYLRSGDLGILWNGELYVVGRRKEMMILRGENHYPEDIEDTLRKCHPALEGEINAAFSLEVSGEERMIVVHEHAMNKEKTDTAIILDAMRAAVAEDHGVMLYAAFLVRRGAIPRTTSGKIQRSHCRNLYLRNEWDCIARKTWLDDEVSAPDPMMGAGGLLKLSMEQRVQTLEQDLARQVGQMLGVAKNTLRTEVPLVRMGLDSVKAADLAVYVESTWGAHLKVVDLLEDWTLERVVRFVAEQVAVPSLQIPRSGVSLNGRHILSSEQERLWMADQMNPGDSAFNLQSAYRVRGLLDAKALEVSVKTIMQRHDILRAAFGSVELCPFQTFDPFTDLAFSIVTWDKAAGISREQAMRNLVRAESEHSFDLKRGKLFRIVLFIIDDMDHVLLLTTHHIISDAWSLQIFERELGLLYSYNTGTSSQQLSEPGIQFADFAAWQRSISVPEKEIAYWRKQMAGARPVNFPTGKRDFSSSPSKRDRKHVLFPIPSELAVVLYGIAQSQDATLFMVLLAAFQVMLGRFCSQEDITVGVPIKARPVPILEEAIGFFAYPLPIRTRVDVATTFFNLLTEVRRRVLEAYANQAVPFAQIAQIMRSGETRNSASILPVIFSYLAEPEQGLRLTGCDVESIDVPVGTADCDLFVTLTKRDNGIRCCLAYNHLLLDEEAAEQFVDSYLGILRAIAAKPDVMVSELSLSDELQKKAAAQQARRELCIAASFVAEPVQTAVEFWAGECGIPVSIRFAPYNQIFQQLLDESGSSLCKADGINVILVRASDLAVSGSTAEHAEKSAHDLAQVLLHAVERSLAHWLLCICPEVVETKISRHWEKSLLEKVAASPAVQGMRSDEALRAFYLKEYSDSHREKIASIPYSEAFFAALGTQLMRKICLLENRFSVKVIVLDCDNTLWHGICGEDGVEGIKIGSEYRQLQEAMVTQQQAGVILCLCSKNNEEDVKAVFAHHKDMPLRYEHLARVRINWRPKSENIRELAEELHLGLDSFLFLDDDQVECAEVQNALPEVLIFQLPREAAHIPDFLSRIWALDRLRATQEGSGRTEFYKDELSRKSLQKQCLTIDKFLLSLNMEINISTPGMEDACRISELTIRTNQFNTFKDPRSEAEVDRILQSSEHGIRVTRVKDRFGDYGLVGVAFFRLDAQALEIETLLLSCRALGRRVERRMMADLAQIARENGRTQIVVRFFPTGKNRPALEFLQSIPGVQVREEATSRVLGFYVSVDDIQHQPYQLADTGMEAELEPSSQPNSSQKINGISRSRLAARIAHDLTSVERIMEAMKKPKFLRFVPSKPRVPPFDWMEEQIVITFEDVLRTDSIGATDNFFELGGHSLLATQVLSRLRITLNVELPITALFEAPTPRQLAQLMLQGKAGQTATDAALTAQPRIGPQPLSFAQERLWFLDQLHRGSPFYNVNAAAKLTGDLNITALEQAFLALVQRHEALRTRFVELNGEPRQIFDFAEKSRLIFEDLSCFPGPKQEYELQKRIQAVAHSPYNLAEDPLIRILLMRLAGNQHVLVIGMHQIVSDGWSMEILVRELTRLYSAFTSDCPSPLPPPVIQYADFALWQRRWLQGEVYKQQLQYWANQLRGLPILNLPMDYARPAIETFRGEHYSLIIPKAIVDELKQAKQHYKVTLYMVLLAVWEVLLQRYSSQYDIVLGTPIANRNRIEAEAVVGFFVNTLVLRTDLSGSQTFPEVLSRISKTTLDAYAHQDLPFEKLVAELQPERDRSRGAFFQVLFELHEAPDKELQMPGLEIEILPVFAPSSRFDLSLNIVDKESLELTFEYNTDLFAPERIERMARHFEILIENVTQNFELSLAKANALLDQFDIHRNAINEAAYKSAVKDRFNQRIRRAMRSAIIV